MTVLHSGTSKKYSTNWDSAFSKRKSGTATKSPGQKSPGPKLPAKKASAKKSTKAKSKR